LIRIEKEARRMEPRPYEAGTSLMTEEKRWMLGTDARKKRGRQVEIFGTTREKSFRGPRGPNYPPWVALIWPYAQTIFLFRLFEGCRIREALSCRKKKVKLLMNPA
jgi:hypothetical protein